jgi:23S rRNA pseudouridine2605 synthase
MEGRNREVRRLWESQGLTVSRLKRVRYGAAFLPKRLRMGEWSEISPKDHQILREDVGLDASGTGLSIEQPGATRGRPARGKKPASRAKPAARRKPRNQRSR